MTIEAGITALAQAVGADIKALTLRGPIPTGSLDLIGNYTMTLADHGKNVQVTSATTVTITVPSTLPDGFDFTVIQNGSGNVVFSAGGRALNTNAARGGTAYPADSAYCVVRSANSVLMLIFGVPLPVLTYENTSALSYTTATLADIAGLSFPVLAGGKYSIDLFLKFTSTVNTGSIKLGLSALPSGADQQLEARIYVNTNASAGSAQSPIFTSAGTLSGTGSTAGGTHLARIQGIIRIGGTGGTITVRGAAKDTTSVIAVGAGQAMLTVTQVY